MARAVPHYRVPPRYFRPDQELRDAKAETMTDESILWLIIGAAAAIAIILLVIGIFRS